MKTKPSARNGTGLFYTENTRSSNAGALTGTTHNREAVIEL